MSSIAMLGAGALESLASHSAQNRVQKFNQQFQQLGQDLQTGNLLQAKNDLTRLQPANAPATLSPQTVSQGFQQLTQDLQSGNLSAAQADYANLQQDMKPGGAAHLLHHRYGQATGSPSAQQELAQLGQALQSGNLSAAQAAYASLQAETTGFGSSGGAGAASTALSTGAALNVAA